jgi:TonB family protein
MRSLSRLALLSTFTTALAAPLASWAQNPAEGMVPMQIIETVEPLFPNRMMTLGVMNGEARVAVLVDDKGQLIESLVTGYSHPEFADAALAALKRWKFEPARIAGEPRSAIREITFTFQSGQTIVIQDLTEHLESRLMSLDQDQLSFRVLKLSELDRIPTPTHVVSPAYPKELVDKGVDGRVKIEFYIDQTGKVRLPAVIEAGPAELMATAINAISQWQFEPPTHNGQPALVRATQLFNFNRSQPKP